MRNTGLLLGMPVRDRDGSVIGRVADTYPFDGSGTPMFALVRLGGFGGVHFVPVIASAVHDGELHLPWTLVEVEDAPTLSGGRFQADQVWASRAYWNLDELEIVERLAPREKK